MAVDRNVPPSGEPPQIPGATYKIVQRYLILRTLEHCDGSVQRTAEMLGVSPRKIQYRIAEYRAAAVAEAEAMEAAAAAAADDAEDDAAERPRKPKGKRKGKRKTAA